jgi:hypothetical protein
MDHKTYRYNIKLPIALRDHFEKPYQPFIAHLLSHCNNVCYEGARQLINCAIANAPRAQPQIGIWTLWMNKDLREQFLEKKSILLPNVSHCEFMFVLLTFHSEAMKHGGCDNYYPSFKSSIQIKNNLPYSTDIINVDKLPPLRISIPYVLKRSEPKSMRLNTFALTTYLQIDNISETTSPIKSAKIMDMGNLVN